MDYHQYKKLKIKDKKYILKNKNIQKKIFIIQVRLAHKFKLTLIVHNREADLDILKLLNSNNLKISIPLLFHSFEGQKKIWQFAKNKENAYLGINGLLTYNDNLKNIIKSIPLAKIVLETDSPYLRPRIKEKVFSFPNTPKNVKIVARYLAKLKNTSLADVEKNSTKNAKKIFGIK